MEQEGCWGILSRNRAPEMEFHHLTHTDFFFPFLKLENSLREEDINIYCAHTILSVHACYLQDFKEMSSTKGLKRNLGKMWSNSKSFLHYLTLIPFNIHHILRLAYGNLSVASISNFLNAATVQELTSVLRTQGHYYDYLLMFQF